MDSSGGSWKITYSGVTTGGKFLEGSLVVSADSWLVLLNAKGSPLEGRCLENGEMISVGSVLRFPSHLSRVNDSLDPSSGFLGRSPTISGSDEDTGLKWHALCSSLPTDDLETSKGFLMLFPSSKRLVLLNHNEVVIDARYLIHGEVVASGISIDLQVKRVVVGTQIFPSPLVKKFSTNVEKIVPRSLDFTKNPTSVRALKDVASCRPALDFSLGRDFEKRIFDKFRHQVNFIGGFRKRP